MDKLVQKRIAFISSRPFQVLSCPVIKRHSYGEKLKLRDLQYFIYIYNI